MEKEKTAQKKLLPGRFITLEGIEGVGKSTHMKFIQRYLHKRKIPYVITREPGGTPVAETIRKILLTSHREEMTSIAELLLLFAGRSQHIANVILPALKEGKWVICDRFTDTSYAYQGYGRKLPLEQIETLEKWVQKDLQPNLVLLFDAPVKVALRRARRRGTTDRIEAEQEEFFERAREGFLKRARQYPQRIKVINASIALSKVQLQIKSVLDKMLK